MIYRKSKSGSEFAVIKDDGFILSIFQFPATNPRSVSVKFTRNQHCGKFVAVKSGNVFSKPFRIPDGMHILEYGVYWFHKDCKLKGK